MRGLPRSVKIMGRRFTVKAVDKIDAVPGVNAMYLGLSSSDHQSILVSRDQGPDVAKDTVLHEVLHCLINIAGMQFDILPDELDEQVVARLTPLLLLFLQENPSVYTFLTGRQTYR